MVSIRGSSEGTVQPEAVGAEKELTFVAKGR